MAKSWVIFPKLHEPSSVSPQSQSKLSHSFQAFRLKTERIGTTDQRIKYDWFADDKLVAAAINY